MQIHVFIQDETKKEPKELANDNFKEKNLSTHLKIL